MADVTPLIQEGQQIIQSYAGGGFRVSGTRYEGAVTVTPGGTKAWDVPDDFKALALENFTYFIDQAEDIDVVLLGCGTNMAFLPIDLRKSLKDKGLSIEVMDTGAACRTYNVLMAEGRRVAAALFPA